MVDRAMANGVVVSAWNCDELYGRDGRFLDGLDERKQAFVAEIPANFHGWLRKPMKPRKHLGKGHKRSSPPSRSRSSEVQNLVKFSSLFRAVTWQKYRIKDTEKGPVVCEVAWIQFWRKDKDGQPSKAHCLIVARHVLTREWKYFVSNRLPGRNGVTIRWLLRVAFGRWTIESCFREAKEELGLDHYEVRGWRCIHRHFYLTQLSHLFCARTREEYDKSKTAHHELTIEQVRSATNVYLANTDLTRIARHQRLEDELDKQEYHRKRNSDARKSHWKKRIKQFEALGIDVDKIKSCIT